MKTCSSVPFKLIACTICPDMSLGGMAVLVKVCVCSYREKLFWWFARVESVIVQEHGSRIFQCSLPKSILNNVIQRVPRNLIAVFGSVLYSDSSSLHRAEIGTYVAWDRLKQITCSISPCGQFSDSGCSSVRGWLNPAVETVGWLRKDVDLWPGSGLQPACGFFSFHVEAIIKRR